ncbi:hypothetical protein V9T40_006682 [Parthenolecanium corni]|uniref:Uncharacterized protein n=1 Tax=Parthenolecanium corni TaxID=536013 RepID=A0AAN9U1U4_9HEMI
MKFLIVITVFAFVLTGADDDGDDGDDGGFVKVRNKGIYVAIFHVSYTLNGQTISKSSGTFPVLKSKTIDIPKDATNIKVKAQFYRFFWVKKTIFTDEFQTSGNHCYKVSGTTAHQSWKKIEPCNDDDRRRRRRRRGGGGGRGRGRGRGRKDEDE